MVYNQVDQHTHAALPARMGKFHKVTQRSIGCIDAIIIGDIVSAIASRRGLKRHQPDGRDAEPLQVIEPSDQALKVANAVAIRVHVSSHRQAVNNCVFIPEVVNQNEIGNWAIALRELTLRLLSRLTLHYGFDYLPQHQKLFEIRRLSEVM